MNLESTKVIAVTALTITNVLKTYTKRKAAPQDQLFSITINISNLNVFLIILRIVFSTYQFLHGIHKMHSPMLSV